MGTHHCKPLNKNQNIDNAIVFTINGVKYEVHASDNIKPETSLNTYLRYHVGLRDTKVMCREGGCGVCIVSVTFFHPVFQEKRTYAVNSCLVSILSCHNWEIETLNGIGNSQIGYHEIQHALAKFGGSQCGFCSGGMVMNMYAAVENSKQALTMKEVENLFGGNLCRCTGYRSIMDAMKSLASDADPTLTNKYPDIEDIKLCNKSQKHCDKMFCGNRQSLTPICLKFNDNNTTWITVYSIQNILDLFKIINNETYRFVAGNTGQGVFKLTNKPKYWIDIRNVKELLTCSVEKNLKLGANLSINDTISILRKYCNKNDFSYLNEIVKHLCLVANVSVRNVATLAGNLILKHEHPEFPSDIFLILEIIGATLTIVQSNGVEVKKSLENFSNFNMSKCILKNIIIPSKNLKTHLFKTYKIMPRAQNAHAYVNAGFLIEHDNLYNVKSAKIVFGGINPNFIHAKKTEEFLVNKQLFDDETLQGALSTLNEELNPNNLLGDASPEFRKQLAMNLYYKFILAIAPNDKVNPKHISGGLHLEHDLMKGVQFYQTNRDMYPITKPVPKLEALIQTSGEAQYIDDIPSIPGEVYGALVLAETVPLSIIKNINLTAAMEMQGVISFIDYKDIPGRNVFCSPPLNITEEELFCSGKVLYNGQPVGVIVAKSIEQAIAAADKVHIEYVTSDDTPAFTIQEVLATKNNKRIINMSKIDPSRKGDNTQFVINGKFSMKGQYHFTMETQNCVCVPTDDGGYDLYAGTQWMNICQKSAATALNLPMSKINVIVKRLGGGYGAKLLRASMISTACAVVSHKLHKPVRLILPITTNMKCIGKRFPFYAEYEVGTDEKGIIQYLDTTFYQDSGTSGLNEQMVAYMEHYMKSGYIHDTWKLNANLIQTDMAGNAYARGPGSTEAIALIENIMEHIGHEIGIDPVQVRQANLIVDEDNIHEFVSNALTWAEYSERQKSVKEFNQNNRWMKKGLSLAIMNHRFVVYHPYSVLLSVFAPDGTVSISHGGIECGQGINTKAVQVCAYELGIQMDLISVKPSFSFISPNNQMTGGSVTSEAVCYAIIQACKELKNRIEPIKCNMPNATWKEIVWRAFKEDIELCTTFMFTSKSEMGYNIPGACVFEVQVDVLTGEHIITRIDLLEDVGSSINPNIDVGQIEGAFVMGLGLNTCENLIYGNNGELLTHNTWNYKIPGVKDVPADFRIMFKTDGNNPIGVLNSKACGEPALNLTIGLPFAIRNALKSARNDANPNDKNFMEINGPTTVEFTVQNSLSNIKDFLL